MTTRTTKTIYGGALGLLFAGVLSAQATTADDVVQMERFVTEEVAEDLLSILPRAPVDAVFGFGKTSLDTPRSVSSVSSEMIDRFSIDDINDVVAFAPGAFTTSFFGIPGQLDIRGAPGETYFRGMKRIENPGNYPTPIGASDRIDIVRGPASPIFGPGKIGGYLNFVPKSARAKTGKYLESPTGKFTATVGSYNKRKMTAEVGGPGEFLGKDVGYYAYILSENSGSFYRNSYLDQFIVQASFDFDLTDSLRVEIGEQYQYSGFTENAGWNRVTQDLIDNSNYMAGTPLLKLDTDGSGFTDQAEVFAANGGTGLGFFVLPGTGGPGQTPAAFRLDPATVHTVKIDPRDVLIDDRDQGVSDSYAFFFDIINDSDPEQTYKNKIFIDYLDRNKRASYGFSQDNVAFSFEEKFVFEKLFTFSDNWSTGLSAGASWRFYDAKDKADFTIEYFDRRDITVGPTPNDRMAASLDDPIKNPWGRAEQSTFDDTSLAIMTDTTLWDRVNLLVGGRVGNLNLKAKSEVGSLGYLPGEVSNSDLSLAYTASLSVEVIEGTKVYVTTSKQPLLITNQTGGVARSVVPTPFADSTLFEGGVKSSYLDDKLFVAGAWYQQTLTSYNLQTGTITATRGTGGELEIRYAPSKHLSLSVAANWQKTVYRPLVSSNATFQFANVALSGIPGEEAYGGTIQSTVNYPPFGALEDFEERSGVPDRTTSINGVYTFDNGFGIAVSVTDVPSVAADRARLIMLPAYTLVNGSVFYGTKSWEFKAQINNATDERYFRANFPEIFGGVTVIPMPEQHYEFTVAYKF